MSKKLIGVLDKTNHLKKDGVITCEDGFSYNLLDFHENFVDEEFIINSLSKIARYTGHNTDNLAYSVGQHSVIMAEVALIAYGCPTLAMQCLWHDASEAYTGDIVKPVKNMIEKQGFGDLEKHIEQTIFNKLNIPYPFDNRVKEIDVNMCSYEMSTLFWDKTFWDLWDSQKTQKMFRSMIEKIKIHKKWKQD